MFVQCQGFHERIMPVFMLTCSQILLCFFGNNSNDNDNNDSTERRNFGFLQSPHCSANCLQHAQVARAQSCANHVQHIERMWYKRTAQLTVFKSQFISLAREGREETKKIPEDELQKRPHTKARNSSPNRDSNPHSGIGDRLGKQTC